MSIHAYIHDPHIGDKIGRAWLRTTITIKIMVANGSLPGKDNSRDIQHGGQAKLIGGWIRIKDVFYIGDKYLNYIHPYSTK